MYVTVDGNDELAVLCASSNISSITELEISFVTKNQKVLVLYRVW